MAVVIDFQSRLAQKKKVEVVESIPDNILNKAYEIASMTMSDEDKTEKFRTFLVKQMLLEEKSYTYDECYV